MNEGAPTSPTPDAPAVSRWLAFKLRLLDHLDLWRGNSILLWAALIGVLGALATLGFREAIHFIQWLMTRQDGDLVAVAMLLPAWQRVLVPTVGGLLAGCVLEWLRRRRDAGAAPDYMEVISLGNGFIATMPTLVRSLSSALSVGSGASLGREGPMVQLAALCASWVGRLASFNEPRLRLLVACGSAAGIAAAYNAPIAGALFVSEIVLGSIAMSGFGPLLVASVTSSVVVHQLLGYHPTYDMPSFTTISGADVLPYVGLGVVVGIAAPQFLRGIDGAKSLFAKVKLALPWRLAIGGLVVGLLSLQVPDVWGNGYATVSSILNSDWTWRALLIVLVVKLMATGATVGSGAVGGVFTPTLFVGAVVGALYAQLLNLMFPGFAMTSAYTAVAMGAMLAATTHAPLMSILMISEMMASYPIVLPLMLSCVTAYTIARGIRVDSVYSRTMRRQREAQPRRSLSAVRVGELIKPDRPSMAPDTPLSTIAEAFTSQRVQYLYVTTAEGRFIGAVSLHDVRRATDAGTEGLLARDLLLRDFPVLRPSMSISDALLLFARHHGERLPVVNPPAEGSKLLGSVTKTDVMFLMQDGLQT